MNSKQLEILTRTSKIKVDDLENKTDRTLLFGSLKIADGNMVYHLYLNGEMFHFTVYISKSKTPYEARWRSGEPLKSFKYRDEIPSETIQIIQKSIPLENTLYPECCDYEFCILLKSKGIVLTFDEIDEERPTKQFYGLLFDELKKSKKTTAI
jgi:hypothetical protein